jgi:hypothetical protein
MLAFLTVAHPCAAQTSGAVAVSGSVSPIVQLTSGGAATLTGNSGGGVTTQSASGAALATVVNFGDVGPGNTSSHVCFTQPLFLRSNVASSLKAALTASAFGAGVGDLKAANIGIGLRNLAAGGPNADISNTTVVPGFSSDPCAAPLDANGIPTFSGTLASLGTVAPGTTLMSTTSAWSVRGSLTSPTNRVLADLKLAIVPQAYTNGTFSATVTLTVTAP